MSEKRGVWLGTKRMGNALYMARHLAIKVGNKEGRRWYEIGGKVKKDGSVNTINGGITDASGRLIDPCGNPTTGKYSKSGAGGFNKLITTTYKTDEEIKEFIVIWLQKHPIYHLLANNCQKFVTELAEFLSEDGSFRLAIPAAGTTAYAVGPGAHTIGLNGTHVAVATSGKVSAGSAVAIEAEGPNCAAIAGNLENSAYAGAMAKVSLFRVETQLGPARVRIEPNLDTGVGIIDGNLEVKFLGQGFSVGSNGLGLSIGPFGFNIG